MSRRKQELEDFMVEARHVKHMTEQQGWHILRNDIDKFMEEANKAWATIKPDSENFRRLQIDVLACRKLISMVEDYETNRISAEREWLKEEFPELYVQADVDNQSPLKEQEGE